jgi:hypothetical protein
MSGTYPSTPEFQTINIKSRHSNYFSETQSGRVQVRAIGGQRWSFTAKYNPMTRDEFKPVYAFVLSQQGRLGTFQITPPVVSSASGNVSGTMLANGAHSIGDSTIAVDGSSGTIKAGDFVKFNGHSKVYMVIADLTGAGTLSIEPALVENVANNEQVIYDNVQFTMRLENDIQEYGITSFEYYEYEIDMVEVL